jgi:hypothetical protein
MNFKEYITEQYWNLSKEDLLKYHRMSHDDMANLLRAYKAGHRISNDEEKMLKAYFQELRHGEEFICKNNKRWRRVWRNGKLGVDPII